MRTKLAQWMLLLAVALLPWQTRWIFAQVPFGKEVGEYGLLSVYLVEGLIVLAAGLYGRFQVPGPRPVIRALFLFLATIFFSVSFGIAPNLSIASVLHVLAATFFFFLLLDRRTPMQRVMWAFLIGMAPAVFIGLFQVWAGWSPASTLFGLAAKQAADLGTSVVELADGTRMLRAYGPFPHPNVFGGYLVVAILTSLFLSRSVSKKQQAFLGGLLSLFALGLVATFSRSAWLALTSAGCAYVVVSWRKKIARAFPKEMLFAVLVGLVGAMLIFHAPLLARLNPHGRLEQISTQERFSLTEQALEVISHHPITGVGIGAFTLETSRRFPGDPIWAYQPVHNVGLLLIAEIGLLGCTLFLFLLWNLLMALGREAPRPALSWASVAAIVILGMFDHYLWSFWAGLALVALMLSIALPLSSSRPTGRPCLPAGRDLQKGA